MFGQRRQHPFQSVEILFVRRNDELLDPLALGDRLESHSPLEASLCILIRERHRQQEAVHRSQMFEHDSLGRHNLDEFTLVVIVHAVRAVEVNQGDGERALRDMREAGAKVATSDEILAGVGAG